MIEKKYTTIERQCLAIVFLVKTIMYCILLNLVVFFVDHMTIKYLVNKANLNGRFSKWLILLEEFDYIIKYKLGRMHIQANYLLQLSKIIDDASNNNILIDENIFNV